MPHSHLLLALPLLLLAACSPSTSTSPTASHHASPNATASPLNTPVPNVDVSAAALSATTIFIQIPNSSIWGGCPQKAPNFAACPFAPSLIARLNALSQSGYFSNAPPNGVCGENYITGNQNGLPSPPTLSSTPNADGTITVVVVRGPPPPNLTVTMTLTNGVWLATDLASGSGASASVFSTKPNC